MSHELIRENFASIRVWQRKDSQAPHKPLLVLLAIKYIIEKKRWVEFKSFAKEL